MPGTPTQSERASQGAVGNENIGGSEYSQQVTEEMAASASRGSSDYMDVTRDDEDDFDKDDKVEPLETQPVEDQDNALGRQSYEELVREQYANTLKKTKPWWKTKTVGTLVTITATVSTVVISPLNVGVALLTTGIVSSLGFGCYILLKHKEVHEDNEDVKFKIESFEKENNLRRDNALFGEGTYLRAVNRLNQYGFKSTIVGTCVGTALELAGGITALASVENTSMDEIATNQTLPDMASAKDGYPLAAVSLSAAGLLVVGFSNIFAAHNLRRQNRQFKAIRAGQEAWLSDETQEQSQSRESLPLAMVQIDVVDGLPTKKDDSVDLRSDEAREVKLD